MPAHNGTDPDLIEAAHRFTVRLLKRPTAIVDDKHVVWPKGVGWCGVCDK